MGMLAFIKPSKVRFATAKANEGDKPNTASSEPQTPTPSISKGLRPMRSGQNN